MRTGKAVTTSSGETANYNYVYENGLLQKMTRGSRILEFSYDASGTPVSIAYRTGATATPIYYYYGVNSRGDVVALYNSTGAIVAFYEYDAYGKLISVENSAGVAYTYETHIANLNPLRYRGYVYDNETGLYYLQSRYYDPETCRFINADGYCSTGQDINGFNMFAYCNNNPIQFIDSGGTRPIVGSSSSNETDDERKKSFEYMKQLTEYNLLIRETKSSFKVHEFIKSYETFESSVYDDGWGNPTIGYGHLVKEGECYDTISIFEAEILFLKDILVAESYVDEFSFQYGLYFNQHQYDALVSVSFNLPSSMVMILDDLSCGVDAYTAFTWGESVPGILARRTDEANIFMYNIYGRTY